MNELRASGSRLSLAGGFFGLLLTATVIAAAAGLFRDGDRSPPEMERAAWLSFDEGADGTLEVREARSNEPLRTFMPATDSFAQGVYRSVVRERAMRGIETEEPLKLGRTSDGQLMLFDPATSTRIALRAFGETNAAVFESLLERVLEGQWETAND